VPAERATLMATPSEFPDRPDHPDFWLISQAVIDNDAQADSRTQSVPDITGRVVDTASVMWLRALVAAAWVDAFIAGARYQAMKNLDMQSFNESEVPKT
jgi:hypothetical protein